MSNGNFPNPPQLPAQIPSPLFSPLPAQMPVDRHIRRGQEEYAHALSALLPQGIAWPRWPETVIMKFVYGLAGIMGWADGRAADLLEIESDPRATIEMLDSWERAWGLPDPCFKTPQTVDERRKVLVMRMTLLGAQSREFFIGIANYLGYQVSISEYRPFMVGVDCCGDNRALEGGVLGDWPCQIGDPSMRFAWTVHVQETKLVWFRAGNGQAGIDPHLRIARDNDLECIYRRWGPAHTLPLFDYSGISDPFAEADRFNVTLRSAEPVTLRDGTAVIDTRPITIYWPQAPTSFYVGSPTFDTPTIVVATATPDVATSVWVNSILSRGGTVSAPRQTMVDLFIKGLKSDGLWPLFDRIWIPGAENEIAGLTDTIAAAVATNVSSANFSINRGYISDPGTGGYIDTHFNAATALGRKYARNSAHVALFVTPEPLAGWSAGGNFVFGTLTGVGVTSLQLRVPTVGVQHPPTYFSINDANYSLSNFSYLDDFGYGFYAMNRSAVNLSQAFRNGRQILFSNNPSQAPENSTFTFCGALGNFSGSRIAFGCFGQSLSIAQHAMLYNRVLALMQAIGAI
jgi:uncharacterized protein YmfQ (DUF2313 family)